MAWPWWRAWSRLRIYKLTATAGAGLWGFVGISYVTFKAVQVADRGP